ncbi:MAG: TIGR04222 domain-containing membrane protein [Methylocystis sp.]
MTHWAPIDILHLPGPQFLALYAIVAAVALGAAFLSMYFADRTDTARLPKIPPSPDPVEIAYLSGGPNAVLRTTVYDLRQRGLVTLENERRLARTGVAPASLTRLQRRVLDAIENRPEIRKIFADSTLRSDLAAILDPLRARLAANGLLQPASVKNARLWVLGIGLPVLLGLAGAKLWIAHELGKTNINGLIVLALFGSIALVAITLFLSRRVASRRGVAFVEAMRLAYAPSLRSTASNPSPIRGGAALDDGALLLIALFGFDALKGTSDAGFAKAFARSNDSGGCGLSSCGGGDGGGGSGCGGCGGGGGD